MEVYLVIIEDRHVDTDVEAFTTAEAAIRYAKAQADQLCYRSEDKHESRIADWLYHCRYSPEGDSVRVIEKELRED